MLGSATFTIVTSTSSISIPMQIVSRAHHFRAIGTPSSFRTGFRPTLESARPGGTGETAGSASPLLALARTAGAMAAAALAERTRPFLQVEEAQDEQRQQNGEGQRQRGHA
jgi:hypothetical protein